MFIDLPACWFPFRIEWIETRTGAVLNEVTVTGPGVTVFPVLAAWQWPLTVRMTWPGGHVTEALAASPFAEP